jgi:hypothetical protein
MIQYSDNQCMNGGQKATQAQTKRIMIHDVGFVKIETSDAYSVLASRTRTDRWNEKTERMKEVRVGYREGCRVLGEGMEKHINKMGKKQKSKLSNEGQ